LPAHKKLIPIENIKDFEKVKNEILFKYKQVEYINHSNFEFEERYFGDGDHLNRKGAEVVSNIINDRIKNF
jgi:lysophospholipase L1-like esterase